jgi:hypothetical protein
VDFQGLVSDTPTNIHTPGIATTIVINAPQ